MGGCPDRATTASTIASQISAPGPGSDVGQAGVQ